MILNTKRIKHNYIGKDYDIKYLLICQQGKKYTTIGIYNTEEEAEKHIPFFRSLFHTYFIEEYPFPKNYNADFISKIKT